MIDLRRVVAEKRVEPARPTAAPKELTRTFDLALTSDKSAYRRDELALLTVVAQADCNLTLVNVDEKGIGRILFPNEFQRDNRIRARLEFRFPGPSAPFRFRLADAGVETVIAMCNASRPVTRGFEPD